MKNPKQQLMCAMIGVLCCIIVGMTSCMCKTSTSVVNEETPIVTEAVPVINEPTSFTIQTNYTLVITNILTTVTSSDGVEFKVVVGFDLHTNIHTNQFDYSSDLLDLKTFVKKHINASRLIEINNSINSHDLKKSFDDYDTRFIALTSLTRVNGVPLFRIVK